MDTKIRAEGRTKNNLDKNCHEQTNNNNQKEQEKSFRNSQPFTKLNYTGCPRKNATLFWRAIAPINFELGIKVGGVLESSGSQL